MIDLSSVQAKLSRADAHAKAIKDQLAPWIYGRPYFFEQQFHNNFTLLAVYFRTELVIDSDAWSLLMGDFVHNLRSALDHLVYALAIHSSRQDPPPGERMLQFPIARSSDSFLSPSNRARIAPLTPNMKVIIERHQPYNKPPRDIPPLLAVLRDLDDADKHRLLAVAMANQVRADIKLEGVGPGQAARVHFNSGPIHDRTNVATVSVQRPTPDLKCEYSASIEPVVYSRKDIHDRTVTWQVERGNVLDQHVAATPDDSDFHIGVGRLCDLLSGEVQDVVADLTVAIADDG